MHAHDASRAYPPPPSHAKNLSSSCCSTGASTRCFCARRGQRCVCSRVGSRQKGLDGAVPRQQRYRWQQYPPGGAEATRQIALTHPLQPRWRPHHTHDSPAALVAAERTGLYGRRADWGEDRVVIFVDWFVPLARLTKPVRKRKLFVEPLPSAVECRLCERGLDCELELEVGLRARALARSDSEEGDAISGAEGCGGRGREGEREAEMERKRERTRACEG
eukprot:scaffold191082_cov36-Tisochrysis_lutea.AAC.1